VVEQSKSKGDDVGHVMMIKLFIWKKKEKNKMLKAKVKLDRSFLVW
jgi:hypothetical protein